MKRRQHCPMVQQLQPLQHLQVVATVGAAHLIPTAALSCSHPRCTVQPLSKPLHARAPRLASRPGHQAQQVARPLLTQEASMVLGTVPQERRVSSQVSAAVCQPSRS